TKYSISQKIKSFGAMVPIFFLFLTVMGVMYSGWASPTESAAIGVLGAVLIGLVKRSLNWQATKSAFAGALRTTGFIFAIILGSFILNHLLAVSQLAGMVTEAIASIDAHPGVVFAVIVVVYLVLGAFMDSFAMVV